MISASVFVLACSLIYIYIYIYIYVKAYIIIILNWFHLVKKCQYKKMMI